MALITWLDKIDGTNPSNPQENVNASDMNQIKTAVNTNKSESDTALDLKAPINSPTFTGSVSGISKSMVGLGNVDNTSDANKPVSSAQQTALNLKANLASPTFTGTVSGITKSMIGLGSVDNVQQQPIDSDLTAIAALSPSNDDVLQRKAGAWTNRTIAQLKSDLDITNVANSAANIGLTAAGDGVTDDRAAIQNAYDTAYTAGYRRFYLPAGTYLMSLSAGVGIYGCLFIKPGTTLFGDGDDTVIFRDEDDRLGVTITYDKTSHNAASLADRNYHLSKFRILGTTGRGYESPIGSSETEAGIFLATAANRSNKITIEHVRCDDLNKESIAVWDAVECTMRHNRVYNCNFDAYNPQLIQSLELVGNYAYGCNIGCEYDGRRTGGVPTYALMEGNEFVNIYEYGIGIEAGDAVKISNNLLVGQLGSTTETFQSIGVYLLPNQGNIDLLEVTGNQIVNFIQGGLSNSVPATGDYVISRLIAKGNSFLYNGENCVRLKAFSTAKILHTEISGNTCNYWNRIDNGSAHQWSAIHIENMDDVSIHGNNFRNVTDGTRNDPLFIKNTSNVRFYGNDCVGPPTAFNSTLDIKTDGTNTGLIAFDNPGLLTVDTREIWGEVPSGTINGVNDTFTIANSNPSKKAVYSDGIRTDPANFSISGTTLTITNALVIPTNSLLIDYTK